MRKLTNDREKEVSSQKISRREQEGRLVDREEIGDTLEPCRASLFNCRVYLFIFFFNVASYSPPPPFSAAFRLGFMPRWICVARRGVWRGGRHQLHRHHRGVYLAPFLPGLSYGPSRCVSVRYHRIAGAVTIPTWGFGIGLRYRGSALSPRLANRRTPISCWRRRAFLSLCYSLLLLYSSTLCNSFTDFKVRSLFSLWVVNEHL